MRIISITRTDNNKNVVLNFCKIVWLSLCVSLFVLSSYSNASGKSTLSAIYDLKNPHKKSLSNNSKLVEGSSEFIRLNSLSDRFEYCQTSGMIVFIAFANHIAVVKQAGFPETKFEAMHYMAKKRNLEYPFDAEEISGVSESRVEKLAIEMGWKYPGSSSEHLNNIAPLFWSECLKLPIAFFEEEWIEKEDTTVYDKDGYDEDGYDKFGLTREDNDR